MSDPFKGVDNRGSFGRSLERRSSRAAIYVITVERFKTKKGTSLRVIAADHLGEIRSIPIWASDLPLFGSKFKPGSVVSVSLKRKKTDNGYTLFFKSKSSDGKPPVSVVKV